MAYLVVWRLLRGVVGYGYSASGNALLCVNEASATVRRFGAYCWFQGCNNKWQTWGIGSRTQWDVTKTFYLGVEVLYQNLHSAQTPTRRSAGTAWLLRNTGATDGSKTTLPTGWSASRSPRLPALIA